MDKDSFVERVTACTRLMYHTAWTMLGNEEDCRDAVQEAILRAWEKRHSLRDEDCFRPWLMRILMNICHTALRRRSRSVPLEEVPEPSIPPPDPSLALALQSLPERLRVPLVLVYAEGMSYQEASRALRLPVTTLTSRIHRAKELLGKELSEP